MTMMGRTCLELRGEARPGHMASEVASSLPPWRVRQPHGVRRVKCMTTYGASAMDSQVGADEDRREKRRAVSQKPWEDSVSRRSYTKNYGKVK